MCGILGSFGPEAFSKDQLSNYLYMLKHRGPDGSGINFGNNYAIGMTRLAINELQDGGQPVSDTENYIHLVFNGEIYNYRELKKKYFENLSISTEAQVIVELYKKLGLDSFSLLEGMFAICIVDTKSGTNLLIRDRVGKKPIWYSEVNGKNLYFSSEAKVLYKFMTKKTFRIETVAEVMTYGYIPSPNSAFKEIKEVPPGSILIFSEKGLKIQKYWQPDFFNKIDISFQEAKIETLELLKKSVQKRLLSERPLGVFLSGGIDSSLIASLTQQLSLNSVKTFTIGFDNPKYDESIYAKQIAKYLGTDHKDLILSPDPISILNILVDVLDQPFADSSIIPTYEIAKFASNEIKVALGGDGGDEIFGGYDRYLLVPYIHRINKYLGSMSALFNNFSYSKFIRNRKLSKLLYTIRDSRNMFETYKNTVGLINEKDLGQIILNSSGDSLFETNNFYGALTKNYVNDILSAMIEYDFEFYLPNDLLVKADLSTMANGLELRSPFLDHNLIEWVNKLPSKFKISKFTTKYMLKEILYELVPKSLVERPKKGFAIPRADWMRNELWDLTMESLAKDNANINQWFDRNTIKKLLKFHKEGKNFDNYLWPILMLELWSKKWLT